jgi:hypothetical protein
LLLVEAKAHSNELSTRGKLKPRTPKGWKNHERIEKAIREASAALNRVSPAWALSRDSHYQLCNRFAWAWKLASLGVPVILMYLGFLNADEMAYRGQPFGTAGDWDSVLRAYSRGVVPENIWGQTLHVNDTPLYAVICSTRLDLPTKQTR